MRKRKLIVLSILICLLTTILCSCNVENKEVKREKELDFTIVEEENIPEELMAEINAKKAEPFKLTFDSSGKEYLYIVVGYGTQKTGGYSIQVEDLFLSNNAIYIDTNLIGPKRDEVVTSVLTYPYIVVKIENIDKKVVFL